MTQTSYDQEGASALAAFDDHCGPVVVDFDETLLLANSTRLFLASTRPALMAYVLVKVLDIIKPWRWTGGTPTRDAWRVNALLRVMPWTLKRWRADAPKIAAKFVNKSLSERLRHREEIVIATLGFAPIVEPLIAAMDLGEYRLVAMEASPSARREGKVAPTVKIVGQERMDKTLVITDSADDLELLDLAGTPLRVVWPDVEPIEPFPTIYFPTRYLEVVKRPGSKYRRKIVKEDLALWILGSIWLADNYLAHALGLVLLGVSFWATYEFGYIDNDRTGDRFEENPQLSDAYRRGVLDPSGWSSLAWTLGVGVLGLFVLRWPGTPSSNDFLAWGVVLVATAGTFWIYNRINKRTRILIFPVLQLLRLGAFVAVVPLTAVADLAIMAMVLMRSFNYYLYRTRREEGWPDDDFTAVRFIVFAACTAFLAVHGMVSAERSTDFDTATTLTAVSLLGWQALLARHSLAAAVRQVGRIDR